MAGVEAAACRVLQVGLRGLQPEPGGFGSVELQLRRRQLQRGARRLLATVVRRGREGRCQHRQHRRHPRHRLRVTAATAHAMLVLADL